MTATLSRHISLFSAQGYTALSAKPFDMFPQSGHVEAIVLLSKRDIDSKTIRVEFSLEHMDMSNSNTEQPMLRSKSMYQRTVDLASTLYLAQVKQKRGVIKRESSNKPEHAKNLLLQD